MEKMEGRRKIREEGERLGKRKRGKEEGSKEDTRLHIKSKNVELIGNTASENQEQQEVQHASLAKDQTSS